MVCRDVFGGGLDDSLLVLLDNGACWFCWWPADEIPESMETVRGLEITAPPGDKSGFLAIVAYMEPSKGPYV